MTPEPASDTSLRGAVDLPMFPLGSVLLPGMALPLQIFEPRYRVMMAEVLASTPPRFGVVLIERGSEVGGGDTRTDVGCTAVVRAAEELADGRLALIVVGEERIRVERWLPDDPHPRAVVRAWPDEDEPAGEHPELTTLSAEVLDLARTAAQLSGAHLPDEVTLSADPHRRVHELATLTPLGALDRLRVLAAPSLTERIAVLSDLVMEQRILLDARRRFGDG